MLEVSACRKYVLPKGVLLVTPLRTMKKRNRRDAAMRIRETIPVAPPVEMVLIRSANCQLEDMQ